MNRIRTQAHFSDKAANGNGDVIQPLGSKRTIHAFGSTTAGVGTADVAVEVSNDNVNWVTLTTLNLTLGTTVTSAVYAYNSAYRYARASLSNLTGTGAIATAILGVEIL